MYGFTMVVLTIVAANKTKRGANCFVLLASFVKLTKTAFAVLFVLIICLKFTIFAFLKKSHIL